jgi:hypothetical protein
VPGGILVRRIEDWVLKKWVFHVSAEYPCHSPLLKQDPGASSRAWGRSALRDCRICFRLAVHIHESWTKQVYAPPQTFRPASHCTRDYACPRGYRCGRTTFSSSILRPEVPKSLAAL